MKKFFALIIIATALINIAVAQKHTVTQSAISFTIKNLGIPVTGTFSGLQADINFDKDKPESSSIEASVDASTINTDNNMRDNHLKSDAFFDVAKYPRITMQSTAIRHKSGNIYQATFNVTIKDKTKAIDVPFTYVAGNNTAIFKGSFKIKRADFGVGNKTLVMSNDVNVSLNIETSF